MAVAAEAVLNLNLQTNVNIPRELDKHLCDTVGKVVHLKVKLREPTDCPIALRGENGPLLWDKDFFGHQIQGLHNDERLFTFPIAPEHMEMPVVFKCVKQGLDSDGKLFWQQGGNQTFDLRQHGHIIAIEVFGVGFKMA